MLRRRVAGYQRFQWTKSPAGSRVAGGTLDGGLSIHNVGGNARLAGRFEAPAGTWPSLEVVRTQDEDVGEPDTDLGPQPILEECRRFVDVVRGEGDPALLDASEAIAGLRVLDAQRRSLETGGWVAPG